MRILLIDNYDSFVYNLLHLIKSVCGGREEIDIILNDKADVDRASLYDRIIISPGPGIPVEAGNIIKIIKELSPYKSILGICLGHQAIAEAFGAGIFCTEKPLHGVKTEIHILNNDMIFENINPKIYAGRYHSWLVDKNNLPGCLDVTAIDKNTDIMALSHKYYDVHGLQFHPESIMTECGNVILKNFLKER